MLGLANAVLIACYITNFRPRPCAYVAHLFISLLFTYVYILSFNIYIYMCIVDLFSTDAVARTYIESFLSRER